MKPLRSLFRRLSARVRKHFREKRYNHIRHITNLDSHSGFLLDLGGGPGSFFAAMYSEPERLILIDLNYEAARRAKNRRPDTIVIVANGERLPLRRGAVGVTICNSVIEHVNNPDELAVEIQRTSRSYFVQTPNGNFPLETHSFIGIPFYNMFPWKGARRLICRLFGADFKYIESVRYLSEQDLRGLFPLATLDYETFLSLKKSYYVYMGVRGAQ